MGILGKEQRQKIEYQENERQAQQGCANRQMFKGYDQDHRLEEEYAPGRNISVTHHVSSKNDFAICFMLCLSRSTLRSAR